MVPKTSFRDMHGRPLDQPSFNFYFHFKKFLICSYDGLNIYFHNVTKLKMDNLKDMIILIATEMWNYISEHILKPEDKRGVKRS